MAISDWFKKAKQARAKKKAEQEQSDKDKRADEGQENYEKQQPKAGKEAWAALNE